jgi:glycosyltransferase involved in cell wall biosynthesis
VDAFPQHQHVLVFNNYRPTWLSAHLQQQSHAKLVQISDRQIGGLIARESPDIIFFHYYPPMTAHDLADLPADARQRTIIYSHWFQNIPCVEGIRRYCFPSPFGARAGLGIPEAKKLVVLNPVADRFFQVRRFSGGPFAVGRHSRDDGIKFSEDFAALYEQLDIPDLQVLVLGCTPGLVQALASAAHRPRHDYWMLPVNTMDVARFLRFVDLYVYKTHDSFAETCPLVILEALAAGIPVVAEAKGGVVDLVVEGETGYRCRSLADYKSAVETLYADSSLRFRFSQQAREWAYAHASLAQYRKRLAEAFNL